MVTLPVFSKRTGLRKSVYDKVAARWKEFGLPGRIPMVNALEKDTEVVCRRVDDFEPGAGEEKN